MSEASTPEYSADPVAVYQDGRLEAGPEEALDRVRDNARGGLR